VWVSHLADVLVKYMLSGIQLPKKWRFKIQFDVHSNCMQDLHGVIFQERGLG
jgi:hypothetical protein